MIESSPSYLSSAPLARCSFAVAVAGAVELDLDSNLSSFLVAVDSFFPLASFDRSGDQCIGDFCWATSLAPGLISAVAVDASDADC